MPGRGEAPEMIQPHHVNVSQRGAQPVDVPAMAGLPEQFPVVNRMAPELSLRVEAIRRHARNKPRPVVFIQQEELRMGPDLARFGRHEERQIAD